MMINWEALGAEVVTDLRSTGGRFWDRLKADQVPIVERAARNLTKYALKYTMDVEGREQHASTIRHIRGILESEAALAEIRAGREIMDAAIRIVSRLMSVALGSI